MATVPIKCYFCHQDIPEENVSELNLSSIFRVGDCAFCKEKYDMDALTTTDGSELVAANLYLSDGGIGEYRFLFRLISRCFTLYYREKSNIAHGIVCFLNHLPKINPQNARDKLPTLLTFS